MLFKEKLMHLMKKDLPTKRKVFLSIVVGFTFSFTFLFFGMTDIYINNSLNLPIQFFDVMIAALVVFFPVWIGISGILILLPGRFFTVAASLIAGVFIAGYLQGNMLNNLVYLGRLTGDPVPWHHFTRHTVINTIIWMILIFLPLVVRYFTSVAIWMKSVVIACILVTGMQGAALVSSYITNFDMHRSAPEYYLSREGAFEVSSDRNIMVFVIDRLDYIFIDAVRESDPTFFDRLDGFTDFNNAVSIYEASFPSATFMTTGIAYDYIKSRVEYFDYAWDNSAFIPVLQNAGYIMNYHISDGFVYSSYNQLEGIADNLVDGSTETKLVSIVRNLTRLSAYRFSPMALKPYLWRPVVVFDVTLDISEFVSENDPLFMRLLTENGLTIQSEGNKYYFLHLVGAHTPFIMDENSVHVGSSDLVSQLKGSFNILYHYMDEMKRLGVYEDATIIITGDHGWGSNNMGFFVKPRGSADTPLVSNNAPVSHANLLATILKSEGFEYSQFGVSVFDVEQDTDGERFVVRYCETGGEVMFYKIIGDARNLDNMILLESLEFYVDFMTGLPVN